MSQSFSIQLGKFLYKNAFPLYNRLYPVFKRKQDSRELKLMSSFVKPGFNVLDIGANIGFYTEILSKLVGPKGSIHAFEPEITNFKHLKHNCEELNNVKLINNAVSDKTGPIKIYLSKMLNVDHRTYPVDDYAHVMEIDAITIDDYLVSADIARVDFIKMDIQGFEMAALKGMEKTLKNNPDIKIITELWPYGLMKAGNAASEVFVFLNSIGFSLFLISETELGLLTLQTVKDLRNHKESYFNVLVSKGNFKYSFA